MSKPQIFSSFSLCRSGHHIVTYWIYAHFYNSFFINEPLGPIDSKYPLLQNVDISKYKNNRIFFTFADRSIKQSYLSGTFNETKILTIRDPFNLFASRIKHIWKFQLSPYYALSLWKEHAKEFLGITSFIKTDKILVNYNKWFRNVDYRKQITKSIKGDKKPGQSVIEYIPMYGAGSSFEGRKYNKRAFMMPVLDRWKFFLDLSKRHYLYLFDEEIIYLSSKIFGNDYINRITSQLHLKKANLRYPDERKESVI